MTPEMRRRLGEAAGRARSRLRAGSCAWALSGAERDPTDAPFGSDAKAVGWLNREMLSRMQEEQKACTERFRVVLKFAKLAKEEIDALKTDAVGVEVMFGAHISYVTYLIKPSQAKRSLLRRFQVTTPALREIEAEAKKLARRFRLHEGQATAAIMTGRLPEGRGRSAVDDRLDEVLWDVIREMKELGRTVPGPGHRGRNSGVRAFWEEVMLRINKIANAVPELRVGIAGDWTTVRSRFKSLCERDPEFREETGGSDG